MSFLDALKADIKDATSWSLLKVGKACHVAGFTAEMMALELQGLSEEEARQGALALMIQYGKRLSEQSASVSGEGETVDVKVEVI